MRKWLLICLFCSGSAWAADYQTQGRDDIARGNPDAAAEHFARALKANPYDAVALNNLAVAKSAQGDYSGALRLLERASEVAPERADIAANLSRIRAWLENYGARPARAAPLVSADTDETLPPLPPLWRKP